MHTGGIVVARQPLPCASWSISFCKYNIEGMYPNFIGPWHFASKCATLHTKTKTRNGVTRVRNGLMSTIQEMSMTIKKVVTSELVVISMIKMTFTDDNFIFFRIVSDRQLHLSHSQNNKDQNGTISHECQ